MRAVATGCSGFVGSHLSRRLPAHRGIGASAPQRPGDLVGVR